MGGPFEDYRNPARQHLSFFHASTCQGAGWRIETDFARLEADTKAAEAAAQKEYDEFMADSKADKAAKELAIENKNFKKQDEEQALVVCTKNLEGTQKELTASLEYFDKLKPSCIEVGVSYDERVARRKEEIASLQEALKILGGEDI